MEKSQTFVSVVSLVDESTPELVSSIKKLEAALSERYSDYELLLVVQKRARFAQEKNLEQILANVPSVRWVQLAADTPKEDALNAGLENAIGDFIVFFTLGQDPVYIVSQSVELAKKGHDVVIGISPTKESVPYRLMRPLSDWLLRLVDYRLPKNATSFRCLSRRAANATMETGQAHQQLALRIQKTGYPFIELPYEVSFAKKKTLREGTLAMTRLMVFNSTTPLRLMSIIGFAGSLVACCIACYSVLMKLFVEGTVSGWASTVLINSIFALFQFIILSFISEYLARLLREIGNPSEYAIVFEKTSSIMVNQDRINVWEESTTDDVNEVQTARNN